MDGYEHVYGDMVAWSDLDGDKIWREIIILIECDVKKS